MSARQRFVANGVSMPSAKAAHEAEGAQPREQMAPEQRDQPALKDASNSHNVGRRVLHDNNIQNEKNNSRLHAANSSGIPAANSNLALAGIEKPLNINSLTRQKTKKGSTASNQNKKDRNLTMDQLKENTSVSHIQSPKPLPMSPRLPQNLGTSGPYLFGASNATLLTEAQLNSPPSRDGHLLRTVDSPSEHVLSTNQNHARSTTTSTRKSLVASGNTLMNSFSPSGQRSFGQSLGPARREMFPMRTDSEGLAEQAHTFDPLSPRSPAEQLLPGERSYDYEAPIHLDVPENEDNEIVHRKHGQHVLRRATKRIDRHDVDDEVVLMREDKRAKLDMRSKEHIDLAYEHQVRQSRAPTPVHRYRTPIPADVHDSHRPQLVHHASSELHDQKVPQFGEGNEAFCRLLGIELEGYLSEHVEQYESAKNRWTTCTIEEWKAGAEEMTGRFSKLVDSVKNHMSTKLALYATLHEKVVKHNVVLGERRSMLKNMQDKLVSDSGTVLGGSVGGTR